MKLGDVRQQYSTQLHLYNQKRHELAQQKDALQEKRNQHPDAVTQEEAVKLDLQYEAVSEQYDIYQKYMNELMERWHMEFDMAAGKQQAEAVKEAGEDMGKLLLVARRLMHGDKVPAKDEQKLMEYDYKLYIMAKNTGAMAKLRNRKEYDSLWADEEEKKESPDAMETAENVEISTAGPEIVSVEETMAQATGDEA